MRTDLTVQGYVQVDDIEGGYIDIYSDNIKLDQSKPIGFLVTIKGDRPTTSGDTSQQPDGYLVEISGKPDVKTQKSKPQPGEATSFLPFAWTECIHTFAVVVRHAKPGSGIDLLEPNFGEFTFGLDTGHEGGFAQFFNALFDSYECNVYYYNEMRIQVIGVPAPDQQVS